ncbi:hypothetical protein LMG29542_04696 [Paraburkholderia humisilvae]|uniref:Uncharacterized protein n=1 Tax=Paraburkholderia humisilvae TaxID=627669 RepID=A0A6J5EBZ2_9BURK|nr:hypothetical protein LMG29542_04696 [Paraburkholderia humisilvae]
MRLSSALTAPSTPSTVLPPTVYSGLESEPSAFTAELPPSAAAVLLAVLYSWEPLIASVLEALIVPAFTFVIDVPAVPPASVILPMVELSYATNEFVTLPDVSTFRPASFNCATFTASAPDVPAARLETFCPCISTALWNVVVFQTSR